MIYLDHSATTLPKPRPVIDAVVKAMTVMGNSGRGVHDASLEASRLIYETREEISDFFGGDGPEQTIFTSNATTALNTVIQGILKPGDRAVTTMMEHNSVLRPLYRMEQQGVDLHIVSADHKGCLSMEEMEKNGLSYTYETLEHLKQLHPDTDYYFIPVSYTHLTLPTIRLV